MNFVIGNGRKALVIEHSEPKKIFCWYGLSEDRKFEVGTIIAGSEYEAKRILERQKYGGVYSIKEINPSSEFETLGVYNHKKLSSMFF